MKKKAGTATCEKNWVQKKFAQETRSTYIIIVHSTIYEEVTQPPVVRDTTDRCETSILNRSISVFSVYIWIFLNKFLGVINTDIPQTTDGCETFFNVSLTTGGERLTLFTVYSYSVLFFFFRGYCVFSVFR